MQTDLGNITVKVPKVHDCLPLNQGDSAFFQAVGFAGFAEQTKKPAKSAGKVQSSPPCGIEIKTSKNWTRPNVTTIALLQEPNTSETAIRQNPN
ncbi:MAG: hypothetical protein CMI12_03715 [Oceanospirillum sp.]|nr:hypothetical protein [Oceanospirillum sp.]